MDSDTLKLLEKAITEGIAAASWVVIIITLVSAEIGAFVGAYLKRKGEHSAIKEDFDDLYVCCVPFPAVEIISCRGRYGSTRDP